MEQKLEAAQETIIDQQLTAEKFRELVHNLNMDLAEQRSMGDKAGSGAEPKRSQVSVMDINVQMKSAIKAQSRVKILFWF